MNFKVDSYQNFSGLFGESFPTSGVAFTPFSPIAHSTVHDTVGFFDHILVLIISIVFDSVHVMIRLGSVNRSFTPVLRFRSSMVYYGNLSRIIIIPIAHVEEWTRRSLPIDSTQRTITCHPQWCHWSRVFRRLGVAEGSQASVRVWIWKLDKIVSIAMAEPQTIVRKSSTVKVIGTFVLKRDIVVRSVCGRSTQ